MKQIAKTVLLIAALTAGLAMPAMAANVQVALPNFPVMLNGTGIDNSYRQYPLLVYNNITYFPMTYYDCRFLGVETQWTQADGLKIEQSGLTGAYHQDNGKRKNGQRATAQLATGKIAVNGKAIANSKEQYPLLVYRDVTYFPLTWRFAVDEFGWTYSYDNKKGLVIDAGNAKTKSVTLQDARKAQYEGETFSFAIDKQYLYYQGEKGAIYRRPLAGWSDDKQRRQVGEIPYEDLYYTGYPLADMTEMGGSVYYRYHTGGASMGGDCLYRVEGAAVSRDLIQCSYNQFVDFHDFQIQIAGAMVGGTPAVPMTYIGKDGTRKAVGAEGYCYQINSSGYDQKRNRLYVSAYQPQESAHLYAMDLYTGATEKFDAKATSDYQYADDRLYYLSRTKPDGSEDARVSARHLYAMDVTTGQGQWLGQVGYSSKTNETLYAAAQNGVYYRERENGGLLFWNKHTGKTETINGGFAVMDLYSQNGYVIAHFAETAKNPHRLLVFAPSGQTMKQAYATADCSDRAVINANGLLVYRLAGTDQLVQVQL